MPRTRMLVAVTLLAVVTAVSPCPAREPFENQWGPFTGTVVDAATGQPIPGAVFTVLWIQVNLFPFKGGGIERFFDARVAVADEQGNFEIPRRSPPFFFPGRVKRPTLSCIGAQNAPISVKLRRLSPEEIRLALFDDVLLGAIPPDKRPQLEKAINQTRKRMGLRAIHFPTGGYQKE